MHTIRTTAIMIIFHHYADIQSTHTNRMCRDQARYLSLLN